MESFCPVRIMRALLIPIKDPLNAKTRLAEVLSEEERRRFAWAMFEDVSQAIAGAQKPDRVFLVTNFAPAIERGRKQGWDVLTEQSQISESESVDWASRVLAERGFDTVMRLPADLPLVRAEDIEEILSIEVDSPGALLVPSREGSGTNAIVRRPPTLFPSRFGPNSLHLHKQEATRIGVECVIVNNNRIGLDIDEPTDLEALIKEGSGTRAVAVLSQMRVVERLCLKR